MMLPVSGFADGSDDEEEVPLVRSHVSGTSAGASREENRNRRSGSDDESGVVGEDDCPPGVDEDEGPFDFLGTTVRLKLVRMSVRLKLVRTTVRLKQNWTLISQY